VQHLYAHNPWENASLQGIVAFSRHSYNNIIIEQSNATNAFFKHSEYCYHGGQYP
jgi:hypothetical protein